MNKRILFTVLFFVFILQGGVSFSQQIEGSTGPVLSVDYDRLERIDTMINGYIKRGWINGVVTLVVRDGKILQYKSYGYADIDSKRAMKKDNLFRLASQTKAIVSAAVMILYEEGKLSLDEPIADFLPAFRHPRVLDHFNAADTTYTTVPAKREITIRDLLTHSSGLDYPMIGSPAMKAIYAKAGIPSGLGNIDQNLEERMNALAGLPLVNQPGEKWTYSLSVDVLGALVEVISGKTLEQFLSERIFRPLGMKDTYFNVPASKAARLTTVYTEDSLQHVIKWTKDKTGIDPSYPLMEKHYFSGGAGLTGTAYDYAIFLQMLLNGGRYNGEQIMGARTVQLMTSGQLPFARPGTDNFGLGFNITSDTSAARGPRHAGTYSWGGFFGTTYWVDPKAGMVCLFMTQQTPNSHHDLEMKFEQMLYASFK